MSDTEIIGGAEAHPRTMAMHQDWQMRDIARADLVNRNPGVNTNALRTSTVVRARRNGDVQIEAFTDLITGQGMWFTPLNFSPCREGDTVVYGYADDVAIVLGRMPDVTIPFMIPNNSMQDTLFFEEFDHGGGTSGTLGLYRWIVGLAGTGTFSQVAVSADHPGCILLQTGTAIGGYAYLAPPGSSGQFIESIDAVGWMFATSDGGGGGTGAATQVFPCITDNFASPANYVGFLNNQLASPNWTFVMNNTSPVGSAAIDTGIPCVDGNWYRCMIKRIGPGEWAGYIADTTNKIDSVTILRGAPLASTVYPYVRFYPLIATTVRHCYVDYIWWSKRGLLR